MKTSTRVFRTMTASLLAVWLGFLVALLVYRQWQRQAVVTEAPSRPPVSDQAEQPVRVQRGFVFTYALGVSPSIRLAAKESVEFASGWLELSDVDVTFFQRGQVAYGLTAAKVRFHQRTSQAVVEGNPLLSLGHGVVARGPAFLLESSEQKLLSRGPVSFAGVGWGGLAGSLFSLLAEDVVVLGDGVSLVAEESGGERVTLVAPVARYRRKLGTVEFSAGVTLFRDLLRFQAEAGTVFLNAETGTPERLVLTGPVEMQGRTADGELVEGTWGDCRAERQGEGSWAFVAEGEARSGWARLRVVVPGGEIRELAAWRLEGVASGEGLERLSGQGLVCALRSRPREQASRLSADSLQVAFVRGRPEEVRASGNVVLEEAAGRAWGDSLAAKLPDGPGELWAAPGREVRFASSDLEGACQRIAFDSERRFTASGGVQGTARGQREDLRFAAREARGSLNDANRVNLVGDARVWQKDQLLRADELFLDREAETIQARGRVLSQITREGTLVGTIEGSQVTYVRPKGEAFFTGGVRLHDPRGTVESWSLLAYLSERGEVLRGEFQGSVVVRDKENGRRILGDAAWYEASTEIMVVTGQPALAEEVRGNRVQASRILWNRRSGTLEVGGDMDAPSQTLYHPEKPANQPARRTPLPRR